MKFYNLKTRTHIEVPEGSIKKMKMVRKTKSGEQVRYALTATYQGAKVFKFINEATYRSASYASLDGDPDVDPPKEA